MANKLVEFFKQSQPQTSAEAQMMADALSQRANQPRGQYAGYQGRVMPAMGMGEGLAQLGEALLARRSRKRANEMTENERKAIAQQLQGLTGPNTDPRNQAAAQVIQGLPIQTQQAVLGQAAVGQLFPDPNAAGQSPTKVQEYERAKSDGYTGTFETFLNDFYGREQNTPAHLQEWEAYSQMTPEQQRSYIEMKRSVPIETVNSVPTRVLAGGSQQPLSTLDSETAAREKMAASQAEGAATGQARGEAVANLPVIQESVRLALDTAEKMLDHPGIGTATGLSRVLDPRNYIPGTNAWDFGVLKNQAQGQVFLDAYQSLKGGGVITEIEGLKAEQAKARMDTAQSDESFREALNDYMNALRRGLKVAEERAGIRGGMAPNSQPKSFNWGELQ